MDVVNEKSTRKLEVYFKDQNGQYVIPDSCTYAIYDITDDEADPVEIKAESSFAPPSQIGQPSQITLAPTDNRVLTSNKYEKRVVTINWVSGINIDENYEYHYLVQNLYGVS